MATVKEKVAGGLVRTLVRLREYWAKSLALFMGRFSRRGQRIVVIAFCTVVSLYSLYLVAYSLAGHRMSGVKVTSIRSPSYITTDVPTPKVFISESDYRKVIGYKKYIDSLQQTKRGQRIADSIARARPGLMDSVLQLEKLYQLQNNNR